MGAPMPPYIKKQGGGRPAPCGASRRSNPTRNRIAIQFLVGTTKREKWERKEREKEKERGAGPPPSLSNSDQGVGAHGPALALLPSFSYDPLRPIASLGGSSNPPGTPVN